MQFLVLAFLGLGAGAIYGLMAQGLVVIYRGSGILNFAQGAFVMAAAYLMYQFHSLLGWPAVPAILAVVFICGIVGALVQLLVMRPMQRSAPLARLTTTLGLLIVIESIVEIRYGTDPRVVASFLPTGTFQLAGGIYIGEDKVIILCIGLVTTLILWALNRFTQFGRITQTVAENPRTASSLGHSPNQIATINWGLGCALAGLAGCLIAPLVGLSIGSLTDLILPAIAAGVVAGFRSFPVAFGAGVVVGIVEAEVSRYITTPGLAGAVPFILIIVFLLVRGTSLPLRDYVLQRLPAISASGFRRLYVVAAMVPLLLLVNFTSAAWQQALTTSLLAAIIGLSIVVVTGFAGQISLVQYGMAGVGGLAAAQIAAHLHVSLVPALVLGTVVTVVVGMLVAFPAIWTRGINLAIVTLGFGVVISDVVFANASLSGGADGVKVGKATLFGWPIDTAQHLDRYASVVVVVFIGLACLVLNLRRGVTGRRMIALRDNERAAASMGIGVPYMKMSAFAIAAFIASIGGILLAFETALPSFQFGFDDFASINIVGLVVLGGVGFASGATFGSLLVTGGLVSQIFAFWGGINQYLALIGGISIIAQLVISPDGLVPENIRIFKKIWLRLKGALPRRKHGPYTAVGDVVNTAHRSAVNASTGFPGVALATRVPVKALEVRDLRVSLGGAVIVNDFAIDIKPGQVVGLIGPNGAGKTTIIDAITGFVRSSGTIKLGGEHIEDRRVYGRVARGVARSFQSIELFESLSVIENLAVACEPWSPFSLFRDAVIPRHVVLSTPAAAAIEYFGLNAVLDKKTGGLSFAQRRLVGIARSVARAPSVLLLDEPGAGLDTHEVSEVGSLIRSLASEWGMGILLVEHHMEMVASSCDRVVVLDRGVVLSSGTHDEVMQSDDVRTAYLGVV